MKVNNSEMSPIQHAPRRVPLAVRALLMEELDRMTEQEIIAPVTLRADRKRVTGHRVAYERFETFIYGQDVVHVDSDHKPLETIVLKPLHGAPQRLQRILLRLQKYNLELLYKKGCDMFLSDTLSRAYLPEVTPSELTQELEGADHKLLLPVSEA